jgi:hypothetical protein
MMQSLNSVVGSARPRPSVVHPPAQHTGVVAGLVREAGAADNLTTYAYLAALAIEHRDRLVRPGLRGFPGVRHRLPY